ncbi:unnamed protein product [Vitrella brassicaformis CCMP3155]|uniref:AN1-type domain-containing protein n=1 Tax=Vitrella brassicaformis (strain CCMP3155) TaxID=1169540 RepID=A0A0G4ET15_VITBC|nr:unnamed protein product [Vitrella brassicaformis CCMP3155]|eukprot:CEM00851.1 unnamed protein product [Vitrella brassicaformis CCMP3155]
MSEQQQQEQQQQQVLCANGCGFFGSASTRNLCSKCWRQVVQEEKAEGASRPSEKLQGLDKALTADKTAPPNDSSSTGNGAASSAASDVAGASTKPEEVKTAAEGDADKPDRPVQVNKNRCWKCRAKIGLLGFECRCGYFFCGTHRYADMHECDFDWKNFERQNLAKLNPEVAPSKLERI